MKCVIIPAIIGVTGIASKGLMKDVEAIPGTHSIFSLQETAIRGTSHIIRKVLQSGTWNLERLGSALFQGENYHGEEARNRRQHNVNNNTNWISMQGRRGVAWDTEITLKYATKERPFQTNVPCFRRNLAFRPDQTRPECLMSWRMIMGIIVRHLMKKCSFRDLNQVRRFHGNCVCWGVLSLSPAELHGLRLLHCKKKPICT